jgi:YceI-like domain
MTDRAVALGVVVVLVALLAACAGHVVESPRTARQTSGELPEDYYHRLVAQGTPVFRVDPAASLVIMEVGRGGSLARLGHDHVVASHDVAGYLAPDAGRADFLVPLDALVVDEPALRAEAGFDTQPSAAAIAGTRRNMLDRVLESDRYPVARVAVSGSVADGGPKQFPITISLHGTTATVDALAQVDKTPDAVTVTGTTAVDQSRFGITPFSVLGGALAVQDRVAVQFRIRARRVD